MPPACSDHAVGRWLPVQDPEPFRGVRFSVFGTRDTEERRNAIRPFEARLVAFEEIGPPRRASPLGQVCLLMNS